MAFKLGSERRKMNIPGGKTPVFRKKLEKGIKAEANNDGSIFVDKSVPVNSKAFKEALSHELGHIKDMENGRANYGDNHVEWEGKIYLRKTVDGEKVIDGPAGRLPEGHPDHPWEKSAIKAESKDINVSNKDGNMEVEFSEDSPMKLFGSFRNIARTVGNVARNNPISMGVRALRGDQVLKFEGVNDGSGEGGEGQMVDACEACEERESQDGDARSQAQKKAERLKKLMGQGGSILGATGGMLGAGMAFERMKERIEGDDAS